MFWAKFLNQTIPTVLFQDRTTAVAGNPAFLLPGGERDDSGLRATGGGLHDHPPLLLHRLAEPFRSRRISFGDEDPRRLLLPYIPKG